MLRSGLSTEEVVFQKYQYMVWEKDVVAEGYGLRMRWLKCLPELPSNPWCIEPVLEIGSEDYWWEVYFIAAAVYWGQEPPPGCKGVTNYDNPMFWEKYDGQPPWAEEKEFAVCYGDHCFWRTPKE